MTPLRSDRRSNDPTTVAVLEAYWRVHWSTFSPSHRSKTRGRLIIMAASLMAPSSSSKGVLRALRLPNQKWSGNSEGPPSPEARAARYLRTHFLPRHDGASKEGDSDLPKQDRSATWIDAHSKLRLTTRISRDCGSTSEARHTRLVAPTGPRSRQSFIGRWPPDESIGIHRSDCRKSGESSRLKSRRLIAFPKKQKYGR
jgi:hypothetical protein